MVTNETNGQAVTFNHSSHVNKRGEGSNRPISVRNNGRRKVASSVSQASRMSQRPAVSHSNP